MQDGAQWAQIIITIIGFVFMAGMQVNATRETRRRTDENAHQIKNLQQKSIFLEIEVGQMKAWQTGFEAGRRAERDHRAEK